MRAPRFWSDPDSVLGALLSPLGAVWAEAGRARRRRARPWRAPVPVICVGNLTLGGAGKTPTAIHILRRLAQRGLEAHALSRGHGGSERGPHRVDANADDPARVGDEPLILAAHAPTWIARDRAAGARAAVAAGAQVLVLDDGFQNPALEKDLSLIVIDGPAGFGSGRVAPAGPLREPVAEGLARADAALILGEGDPLAGIPFAGPVLRGRVEPAFAGTPFAGMRALAFAGIGRPEKFFAMLRELGVDLAATRAFPDHAVYDDAILRRLAREAEALDAQMICTEKDAVKFPAWFRGAALPVPAKLTLRDENALDALLDGTLRKF
ncbi:tetraacyldisaccharide 4'-kinase [Neomegalonema sp.]|uniref:tetraacyldisaccharide 4'-kinase n=1 Tax=Neomegalonema sp. TaxID=2039713 RepID=UPI00261EE41F|nr:tetraacyldisaccharide 4'-kinase [Neomegalonema sp.]MDD2869505.1 tetraacyldisaccharide 4'-kinase [Neomegalonema sp.]